MKRSHNYNWQQELYKVYAYKVRQKSPPGLSQKRVLISEKDEERFHSVLGGPLLIKKF